MIKLLCRAFLRTYAVIGVEFTILLLKFLIKGFSLTHIDLIVILIMSVAIVELVSLIERKNERRKTE